MKLAVIIPAAGASRRFNEASGLGADVLGESRSKLDEDLGGRPLLQRSVELFTARDEVCAIVVAGPHDDASFAAFELRHSDRLTMLGAVLCRGGATHRWETVRAALDRVPADATHVAVHDAARPVTRADLIDRVLNAARLHPAVVPAVDVADTLKRVGEDPVDQPAGHDPLAAILGPSGPRNAPRPVEQTIDRRRLVAVQTPQVFDAGLLRRAYAQSNLDSTDDAGLVERLGEPVVVVRGDVRNVKVTVPEDVEIARIIGGYPPPKDRPTWLKF